MEERELIEMCISRNELSLLHEITKVVAESDSIGEGYSYCGGEYTLERFNLAISNVQKKGPDYFNLDEDYLLTGLEIYEIFLQNYLK